MFEEVKSLPASEVSVKTNVHFYYSKSESLVFISTKSIKHFYFPKNFPIKKLCMEIIKKRPCNAKLITESERFISVKYIDDYYWYVPFIFYF